MIPGKTDLNILIDRSGSMFSIKKDMEGALHNLFEEQKKVPGEVNVTVSQFDRFYENVFTNKPLGEVGKIEIEPRGTTALLDSLSRLIDETGQRISNIPESKRPEKVIFVVITDGAENSSTLNTRKQVFDKIEHQRTKYNWEFLFVGANQDSFAEAGSMGISHAVNYQATARGVKDMAVNVANYITSARTGLDTSSWTNNDSDTVAE